MKEKLKKIWFVLLVVSVLLQTALTFFLLYRQSRSEMLDKIIFVLLLTYIFAFLIIVIVSFPSKKISHEAMVGYKRSQKSVKRILTLLMLVLSIINIVQAKGSGLEFTLSIIMIVYNLFVIYIDMKISRLKDKIYRKKKSAERKIKELQIQNWHKRNAEDKTNSKNDMENKE